MSIASQVRTLLHYQRSSLLLSASSAVSSHRICIFSFSVSSSFWGILFSVNPAVSTYGHGDEIAHSTLCSDDCPLFVFLSFVFPVSSNLPSNFVSVGCSSHRFSSQLVRMFEPLMRVNVFTQYVAPSVLLFDSLNAYSISLRLPCTPLSSSSLHLVDLCFPLSIICVLLCPPRLATYVMCRVSASIDLQGFSCLVVSFHRWLPLRWFPPRSAGVIIPLTHHHTGNMGEGARLIGSSRYKTNQTRN